MTTFYLLLLAVIVIFAISRAAKVNRIDEFAKLLASLTVGLLLGAAVVHIDNKISNITADKSAVVTTDTVPTQNIHTTPFVGTSMNNNDSVSQDTITVRDTEVTEAEETKSQLRNPEIIDDS